MWLYVAATAVLMGLVIVFVLESMVSRIVASQTEHTTALIRTLDRINHARYVDLLRKLSVLRRQNEVSIAWYERRHSIDIHELSGRPELAAQLKLAPISEILESIEDWAPQVESLDSQQT